jgi:hypothetical protein
VELKFLGLERKASDSQNCAQQRKSKQGRRASSLASGGALS